jgi:MFS family permease
MSPPADEVWYGAQCRRRSIISQFDLVCEHDWAAQATNTAYFVGFLIGAGLWGALSDRIGELQLRLLQSCCVAAAECDNTMTGFAVCLLHQVDVSAY